MVRPPLTDRVWPVMNPAASLAKKLTAAAMSDGSPKRRIGTARTMAFITASALSCCSSTASMAGVLVGPGQTTFAVTPARAAPGGGVLLPPS